VKEPYDKVGAIVVGWDQFQPDTSRLLALLGDEMRLAKAGALYADDVILASQATSIAFRVIDEAAGDDQDYEPFHHRIEELLASLDDQRRAGAFSLMEGLALGCIHLPSPTTTVILLARWVEGMMPPNHLLLVAERSVTALGPATFKSGYAGLMRSPAGLARLEELENAAAEIEDDRLREEVDEIILEDRQIRSGADPQFEFLSSPLTRSAEATLLTGVLGGLRAFPDADWDVILDVRERLEPSRVNFRAVIAAAADELKNFTDPDGLTHACVSLQCRVVAPALAEIEAELDDLGAVDTLLRVSKETPAVGALVTNLALVAGDPAGLGLSALAHGLASAPMIASGARELAHRRERRRKLAAQPFWLLHEIDRMTS
jgi:hypothetical protein